MGRCFRQVAEVVLFLALAGVAAPALADEDDQGDGFVVPGEILVELAPGTTVNVIAARYQLLPLDGITQWRIWRLKVPDGLDPQQLVVTMQSDPDVLSVDEHQLFESPEGVQISIPDLEVTAGVDDLPTQPAGVAIKLDQADPTYDGSRVVVALLDTGVSLIHPDIADSFLDTGSDLLEGNPTAGALPDGIDNDIDGVIDEALHHATFAAGLIKTVAPEARILPLRILDAEGRGSAFSLINGLLQAVERGADVINLSLSLADPAEDVDELIERALEHVEDAGVVVIAATGNLGLNEVDFPANQEQVIAVAAVDSGLAAASFTNYGEKVDLSAPGVDLLSVFGEAEYARWSGTSFAAPLVTAAVALLLDKYPCLDPEDVPDLLAATAQPDANPQLAGLMGAGVLDLAALTAVLAEAYCLDATDGPEGTVVGWSPVEGAEHYDVSRGLLSELRMLDGAVDLGPLSCVADDALSTSTAELPDPEIPTVGQGFFYVFRTDGPSTYGTSSSSAPRLPGTGDCPAN